jgi:hypothetical protein
MNGLECEESGEYELKIIVCGKRRSKNDISILIDKSLKNEVVDIIRQRDIYDHHGQVGGFRLYIP